MTTEPMTRIVSADQAAVAAAARCLAAGGLLAFPTETVYGRGADARNWQAAARLAEALWPGRLTLVVPKRPDCGVAELATAGLATIALRVPDHPVALAILGKFGAPVVAPSANRSGHVS